MIQFSIGVTEEKLDNIKLKIKLSPSNKIKNDKELNEQLKNYINESYIMKNTTFSKEKDKAIEEATNLYNSMFTYGIIFTSFCTIIKDFKIGINKY